MEETQFKRQREEEEEEVEVVKRQKSYKDILSILDEDEDESTQDLSSLISTLQQEISSSFSDESTRTSINDQIQFSTTSSEVDLSLSGEDGEDEAEKVIRHLLEASDDELGIPTTEDTVAGGMEVPEIDGGDWLLPMNVAGGDGLWEIEDEAANYYTMLQSELFL